MKIDIPNRPDILAHLVFKESVMKKVNLELFDSEWAILQVVWEIEPCTAPTVQEILQTKKGWVYTTIKTMMDRMVKKGLLKKQKIRNIYLYNSAVTQSHARRSEIMRTLRRAFGGTIVPMVQFLIEHDELLEPDYKQLERLVRNRKCRKSTPRKRR